MALKVYIVCSCIVRYEHRSPFKENGPLSLLEVRNDIHRFHNEFHFDLARFETMEDKDAEVVVELWFENVMLENLNIYL